MTETVGEEGYMAGEGIDRLERRIADAEALLSLLRVELRAADRREARRLFTWKALTACSLTSSLALVVLTVAPRPPGEAVALATPVKAPFHVVDKAGKILLRVEENYQGHRGVFVHNRGGKTSAQMGESKKGNGFAEVFDAGGATTTLLGGVGGLAIWKGDIVVSDENKRKRTEIGRQGVRVFDDAEQAIARFGADPSNKFGTLVVGAGGTTMVAVLAGGEVGSVTVSDSAGKTVADIGAAGVQVFHDGTSVARLGLSPGGTGAGYLAIGNPGGSAVVEAGMLPDGFGVVRAYPLSGNTPIPIPNFIQGSRPD
jgi:hypothetical protein